MSWRCLRYFLSNVEKKSPDGKDYTHKSPRISPRQYKILKERKTKTLTQSIVRSLIAWRNMNSLNQPRGTMESILLDHFWANSPQHRICFYFRVFWALHLILLQFSMSLKKPIRFSSSHHSSFYGKNFGHGISLLKNYGRGKLVFSCKMKKT